MLKEAGHVIRIFRDTALAGMAWMFTIWLVFSKQLGYRPRHPVDNLASAVQPIGNALTNVGTSTVLLVIATLVGSVSVQVFRAPALWLANLSALAVGATEKRLIRLLDKRSGTRKVRRFDPWEPLAVDLARRIVHHHRAEIEKAAGNPDRATALERKVYTEADLRVRRELAAPDKASESFIKELNSQASFRLTMVVPILALGLALPLRFGIGYSILLTAPFILAFQAVDYEVQRDIELEKLIWPAIDLDELAKGLI